jgi:hypothetical protein
VSALSVHETPTKLLSTKLPYRIQVAASVALVGAGEITKKIKDLGVELPDVE